MASKKTWIAAAALAATAVVAGGGVALASNSGEGPDVPITGDALAKASAAALAHTGGGTVTDTEVGDEQGAYEVEVTHTDGARVDVHLNANFDVLSTEADGRGEDEAAPR